MAATSRRGNGPVLRSISPSEILYSHAPSSPFGTPFTASTSTFFNKRRVVQTGTQQTKRLCSCSPTTHKGSFRCSLHKGIDGSVAHAPSLPVNRLHAVRRSAMTNSLVRICGVEGELVKRALAALIRPSSHSQRRKNNFKPRPSGLSVMSKAHS